jgi:hypothetical protein
MQPDAEHEQDDAELGELLGKARVRDEAGGERPDENTGEQVSHDGREPQLLGYEAEDQGARQASGQSEDQGQVVRHVCSSCHGSIPGRDKRCVADAGESIPARRVNQVASL